MALSERTLPLASPARRLRRDRRGRLQSMATLDRRHRPPDVARTIRRHRKGILVWFDSRIANDLVENINNLVQAAKAKARGYRSSKSLKAITYLIAGKLDLRLPT